MKTLFRTYSWRLLKTSYTGRKQLNIHTHVKIRFLYVCLDTRTVVTTSIDAFRLISVRGGAVDLMLSRGLRWRFTLLVLLGCSFLPSVNSYVTIPMPRSATKTKLVMSTQISLAEPTAIVAPPQRYHNTYTWKGYNINYRVEGPSDGPPIILVHGFGASVGHWRFNIPVLAASGYRTYAIDVSYCLELWQELLQDFMNEMSKPEERWLIMGNSIGGLLSLMVTAALEGTGRIKAAVLFNSSGGMVSFREEEVPPLFYPVWVFLNKVVFGDIVGPWFFQKFKSRENVTAILKQVYIKQDNVDDELVDILLQPSDDAGATEVFLSVLRGPAGPRPEELLTKIQTKILALWGEKDEWTPYTTGLHAGITFPNYCDSIELVPLPDTGHCPHDERPDECHAILLPWLEKLEKS